MILYRKTNTYEFHINSAEYCILFEKHELNLCFNGLIVLNNKLDENDSNYWKL